MKTAKEIANSLNEARLEYGEDFAPSILADAKENNILIVFGESDDLIEFRGAFTEEAGAGNRPIYFTADGRVPNMAEVKEAIAVIKDNTGVDVRLPQLLEIVPYWCKPMLDGRIPSGRRPSWHYSTALEHEEFNIWEDGELYCVGLVIQLPSATVSPAINKIPKYTTLAELSEAFKSGELDDTYFLHMDKGGNALSLNQYGPDDTEDARYKHCQKLFRWEYNEPLTELMQLVGIRAEWA